ncbi:restriction endonuclease subunit S [Candidatus Pacearchaeota archaeon]|nr:restriction endonuclease subunit S [Candidatus Pacearchaeota archaeon]
MKTKISTFLKERQDRFKPIEANKLGLQRLYKINFSGEIHLAEKPTNTNMILVKSGDLVISGINVEKGAVAVYQGGEDILATIHYSSYEFDESKIDIDYFKWFLKSDSFRKIVQSQTRGGIKTELKSKKFLPLEIDLPDLKSQKQILKKINSMENEIKQLEQNVFYDEKLLKKLRQSILQEAVQGKLVPQNPKDESAVELLKKIKKEKEKLIEEGKIKKQKELPFIEEDEIPYELPRGWVWVRLNDLVSLLGDGLHGTPNYSKEGEYFFINGNNLNKGQIVIKENTKRVSKEEYNKYKKILNERTLFVSINGTLGNIAFYNSEKIMLGKSACYFNLSNKIDKNYIKLIIETNYFLDYCFSNATGSTIKNVSLNSMRLFPVPLPSLAEQKRIVEKVDSLIGFCDELELRIGENKESSERLMRAVLGETFGRE